MFWSRWTRAARPAEQAGRALYTAAAEQARQPVFYAALGAPDTANGRFELYSLHIILLLHRLKNRGDAAAEAAQALFDTWVKALDDALREQGVGDLSMAKSMRRLAEAFYGRVRSYDAALGDAAELRALIARTVYGADDAPAEALAAYAEAAAAGLETQADADLLAGRVTWPEVRA
jgi:cytochrome b pre-mRNA-processing protein 3